MSCSPFVLLVLAVVLTSGIYCIRWQKDGKHRDAFFWIKDRNS